MRFRIVRTHERGIPLPRPEIVRSSGTLGELVTAEMGKLARAARDVCGEAPAPNELGKRARYRACVASAADTAVAKVDAPLVTARHMGRNPAMLAEAR